MKIGVLALQGDFAEHSVMLQAVGRGGGRGAPAARTWTAWTG